LKEENNEENYTSRILIVIYTSPDVFRENIGDEVARTCVASV